MSQRLGWHGLRVGAVISMIAAVVAVASARATDIFLLQKTRNERAAVESLRTINRAQAAYAAGCGGRQYATSLMDLATPPPGKRGGYVSPKNGELGRTLTAPVKGYFFTVRAGRNSTDGAEDCNGFPTQSRYYAIAVPIRQGVTGDTTFATNQDGAVWAHDGLPPPSEPFGPPSRPVSDGP